MRILDYYSERRWAIFSVPEARKKSYGCVNCTDTIELAKKMRMPVLGYQDKLIAPKWEMVAVWNGSSISSTPLTDEDVRELEERCQK